MQRQDIVKILSILKTAYPRFYANMSREDANETIDLWLEMFQDTSYQILAMAVKNLINSFQYPPTIADVKNEVYKLCVQEEKTDVELWNELRSAIRNGIYNSAEIFPTLSEELQIYLKNPAQLKELAMSSIDEIDTVQKGMFLKQMPIIKQREKEKAMMLPERREFIEKLAEKMSAKSLMGEPISNTSLVGWKNEN